MESSPKYNATLFKYDYWPITLTKQYIDRKRVANPLKYLQIATLCTLPTAPIPSAIRKIEWETSNENEAAWRPKRLDFQLLYQFNVLELGREGNDIVNQKYKYMLPVFDKAIKFIKLITKHAHQKNPPLSISKSNQSLLPDRIHDPKIMQIARIYPNKHLIVEEYMIIPEKANSWQNGFLGWRKATGIRLLFACLPLPPPSCASSTDPTVIQRKELSSLNSPSNLNNSTLIHLLHNYLKLTEQESVSNQLKMKGR